MKQLRAGVARTRSFTVFWALVLGAMCVGAMCTGCGSGRRSEPLVGPVELKTEAQRRGEAAFFLNCHKVSSVR